MFIALNWRAFETLLVDMPKSLRVVVSVIPHRVRTTNPFHESAQFTVDQRSQHEVVVIGHQLVG